MKKLKISWYTLQYANTKEHRDKFASFLIYKSLYSNSCIFDYTAISLAKKANTCQRTVQRHVTYFKKHGWVFFHQKNLIFSNLDDITYLGYKHLSYSTINIDSKDNIKNQLLLLELKNKQRQALYANKKGKTKNISTKKSVPGKALISEISHRLVISYNRLAAVSQNSKTSTFRGVKKLIDSGMLYKRRNFLIVLKNATKIDLMYYRKLHPKIPVVLRNGQILRCMPNSYFVPDPNCKFIDDADKIINDFNSKSINIYSLYKNNNIKTYININTNTKSNTRNPLTPMGCL